jgi:chemotaxis protein CheX
MPSTPLPPEKVIVDAMVRAAVRVFKTMAQQDLRYIGPIASWDRSSDGMLVIGSVGFAGKLDGLIYLALPETTAIATTARILGQTPEEIAREGVEPLRDTIGELTNMTAGGFKNVLCDLGLQCMLTLPMFLRGHQVTLCAVKAASRYLFAFDLEGGRVVVDLQMKPSD